MITSINHHVHPWIFVGPLVLALAACPQDKPGATDDPQDEDTTAGASTSTTTEDPTTSGSPGPTTGETAAPSEPDGTTSSDTTQDPDTTLDPDTTTSSSTTQDPDTTSTTTLDPDTTGGGVCALDLTPTIALGFDKCDQQLTLIVTVHNVGTIDGVPAGMDVTIFEGTDSSGIKLATMPTSEPLPAVSSTDIVLVVPAEGQSNNYFVEVDPGPNGGSIAECDETNNTAVVIDAACPN